MSLDSYGTADEQALLARVAKLETRLRRTADRQQATPDLLDALARPDGRDVRKAWEHTCLLYGRSGDVMQRRAFEQYLDELGGIDS